MMTNQDIVYCAGGIVWRETERGREVLLILSRDDRAWKFPKGHIDDDDPSWDYAAQREVKEETGYDTVITDFAGFRKYPVNGRRGIVLKVVLYWHMAPVGEHDFVASDEIEHCEWVTLREAVDRLTFLNDKQLLLSVADLEGKRDG
ncbi:MAG: NUDIX domain-containing protein [Acidobacteriota bacterium]|nr:NUDIX domain-containing protein [Acidobacteriota bacterium]